MIWSGTGRRAGTVLVVAVSLGGPAETLVSLDVVHRFDALVARGQVRLCRSEAERTQAVADHATASRLNGGVNTPDPSGKVGCRRARWLSAAFEGHLTRANLSTAMERGRRLLFTAVTDYYFMDFHERLLPRVGASGLGASGVAYGHA